MGKKGSWDKKYESTCLYCFKSYMHVKKPDQSKYCSRQCGDNFRYLVNRAKSMQTSNCKNCNTEFTHKNSNAVYCSQTCINKSNYDKEYKRLMKAKGTYKYKSFVYKPDEHLNINADLAVITQATGLKEKTIVAQLINKERKRIEKKFKET